MASYSVSPAHHPLPSLPVPSSSSSSSAQQHQHQQQLGVSGLGGAPPTSSMSHSSDLAAMEEGAGGPPEKKRKKLPACDACKHRRVRCLPVPQPGSCPRCADKGIRCVTTPVVRRKPQGRTGKRIEEAKAKFGAIEQERAMMALDGVGAEEHQSLSALFGSFSAGNSFAGSSFMPAQQQQHAAFVDSSTLAADDALARSMLSGELVAHLLDTYRVVPQSWLPLFPRGALAIDFSATYGRNLEACPPATKALVMAICAITARVSAHPVFTAPQGSSSDDPSALVRTDGAPPDISLLRSGSLDARALAPFGQRRDATCESISRAAQACASSSARVAVNQLTQPDAVACCYLLELLLMSAGTRSDDTQACDMARAFGDAFVSGLRALKDADERDKDARERTHAKAKRDRRRSRAMTSMGNDTAGMSASLDEEDEGAMMAVEELKRMIQSDEDDDDNGETDDDGAAAAAAAAGDEMESEGATPASTQQRAGSKRARSESKAGQPSSSDAFLNLPPAPKERVMAMPLGWCALIMRDALTAINASPAPRQPRFTSQDDVLLCKDLPTALSLDDVVQRTSNARDVLAGVDIRDSVRLFFQPMKPYAYHVTLAARAIADELTGVLARRRPLAESTVATLLGKLDTLATLLHALQDRIALVLSPAAVQAHALPETYEAERAYIMKACLYTLELAWCSLVLPVHLELSRRVGLLEQDVANAEEDLALAQGSAQAVAEEAPRCDKARRACERAQRLKAQTYRRTLRAAKLICHCVDVRSVPSISFLTHLQHERLDDWCRIVVDAPVTPLGVDGGGLTRDEKRSCLQSLYTGLNVRSWAWQDRSGLIGQLERALREIDSPSFAPAAPVSQPILEQQAGVPTGVEPPSVAVETAALGDPWLSAADGMDTLGGGLQWPTANTSTGGGSPWADISESSLDTQQVPTTTYDSFELDPVLAPPSLHVTTSSSGAFGGEGELQTPDVATGAAPWS